MNNFLIKKMDARGFHGIYGFVCRSRATPAAWLAPIPLNLIFRAAVAIWRWMKYGVES